MAAERPLVIELSAQYDQGWTTGSDSSDNVIIAILVTVIVYYLGALIEKVVYLVSWAIGRGPVSARLGKRIYSNILSTVVTTNRWLTVIVHFFMRKCGFADKADFLVVVYPRGLFFVKFASIVAISLLFAAEFGAIFLTNIKSYNVVFGNVGEVSVASISLDGMQALDTLTSCNDVRVESQNIVYFESSIQIRSCHLNNYVDMPVFAGTNREVRFYFWPSVLEMRLEADNVTTLSDLSAYLKVELELVARDFSALNDFTDGMKGLSVPFADPLRLSMPDIMPDIMKKANPSCTLTPVWGPVPIARPFLLYETQTPESITENVFVYSMNVTCTEDELLSSTLAYMSRNLVFNQTSASVQRMEILGEQCDQSQTTNCIAFCSECLVGVEGQRYFKMEGFVYCLIVVFFVDSMLTMWYKYLKYRANVILEKDKMMEVLESQDSGLGAHLESDDDEGLIGHTSVLNPGAHSDRASPVPPQGHDHSAPIGSPHGPKPLSPADPHSRQQHHPKTMPQRDDSHSTSAQRFGLKLVDYAETDRDYASRASQT
ncbi:hypothetical protein FVE85_1871 [Porphyridium purpureum]|uniref:Transmembrane protein n=1 Tax=Porphyridium purpureum TaxID=35688 RepID=A0A5J4YWK0_PORPP|nr:hypothetical protein FVE85_1871 [Porphyridium purpureum]|eukprot:POR1599..scf209_3